MSRRQPSPQSPHKADQRATSNGSAKQLVAWAAVGVSLAAGTAWFFFHDQHSDSDRSANAVGDHETAPTSLASASDEERPGRVTPAVRNVSWPQWDELQGNEGDAGGFDAGAPQDFGAEVVVPVIPPPGEAPKRAQDTGLQFATGSEPASQTPTDDKANERKREPSKPVAAPASNQAENAVVSPTLPVAVHERTATEEPPPRRQTAPDRGLVFSDSPAPLPAKR